MSSDSNSICSEIISPPPEKFDYRTPMENNNRPKSKLDLNAWLNEDHLKKRVAPKKRGTLTQQAIDYTGQTSIHGIFYIGEDGRTIFER